MTYVRKTGGRPDPIPQPGRGLPAGTVRLHETPDPWGCKDDRCDLFGRFHETPHISRNPRHPARWWEGEFPR